MTGVLTVKSPWSYQPACRFIMLCSSSRSRCLFPVFQCIAPFFSTLAYHSHKHTHCIMHAVTQSHTVIPALSLPLCLSILTALHPPPYLSYFLRTPISVCCFLVLLLYACRRTCGWHCRTWMCPCGWLWGNQTTSM